eukprot:CAMPEP_0206030074 /NCGR_PEP_ID=MMETSP1464-20131121/47333_1 /ASSEMBLY_ACC=CAM_ASM_001124 /TAXON_ID=119497 /ORGANISM="Exanthemachrysis gayraliae, Strain RCC1523" /LENGTH=348 /DNA_ID=CAMNT_0053404175 /DNA_START=132 /DNA_END=1179 /DNA_ORIENTATION=+
MLPVVLQHKDGLVPPLVAAVRASAGAPVDGGPHLACHPARICAVPLLGPGRPPDPHPVGRDADATQAAGAEQAREPRRPVDPVVCPAHLVGGRCGHAKQQQSPRAEQECHLLHRKEVAVRVEGVPVPGEAVVLRAGEADDEVEAHGVPDEVRVREGAHARLGGHVHRGRRVVVHGGDIREAEVTQRRLRPRADRGEDRGSQGPRGRRGRRGVLEGEKKVRYTVRVVRRARPDRVAGPQPVQERLPPLARPRGLHSEAWGQLPFAHGRGHQKFGMVALGGPEPHHGGVLLYFVDPLGAHHGAEPVAEEAHPLGRDFCVERELAGIHGGRDSVHVLEEARGLAVADAHEA